MGGCSESTDEECVCVGDRAGDGDIANVLISFPSEWCKVTPASTSCEKSQIRYRCFLAASKYKFIAKMLCIYSPSNTDVIALLIHRVE